MSYPWNNETYFNGKLTSLGKYILFYYFFVYLLGLVLYFWLKMPFSEYVLLQPFRSEFFGLWQLLTNIFIINPNSSVLEVLISFLIFWYFAWQIEFQLGAYRLVSLLVFVPFFTSVLRLLFNIAIFDNVPPFSSYSILVDILIVAYCTINRNSIIRFMFTFDIKAFQAIFVLVLFHFIFFLAKENHLFFEQVASIALTYFFIRYRHIWSFRNKIYFQTRSTIKQKKFRVINGGKDKDYIN